MDSNPREDFDDLTIECIDHNFPGPEVRRIVIDAGAREVVFENCLWPRKFFSNGYLGYAQCDFENILAAREYGVGELKRLHISTPIGRCAISPAWDGYAELRDALQAIATVTKPGFTMDDPRILMPLVVGGMLAVTGGIIWFLL